MSRSILAAVLVLSIAPMARAADGPAVPTLAIGSPAPDFDLPGVDGRRYSLRSFADAKLLVLVFTANHCPTAQAYEERIKRMQADYGSKGVALVAVSPNDPLAVRPDELGYSDLGDSLDDMKIRAREHGFTFPYLYDGETEAMSLKYGPVATPHVFVFDRERKLRFTGRIDDKEDPTKVTVSDTRNAIDALLAGKPAPVETTKVFGCSVKWADKKSWTVEGRKRWAAEPVSLDAVDEVAIREIVKNPGKKLRLVNVWATWCGPCVTEFPELVTINRMYRGRDFELVTISADPPEKREAALEFLQKQEASSRNTLFSKGDPYALIDVVDPEWRGALPHTILIAPGGKVIHRSEGAFDPFRLKKAIVGYLGRYYHSVAGAGQ
ncbi:MAG: redoxin domain-containing protein [Solirubrobacterales bacterium]|jgi:thiol-disulfide isomerase/thioredoxin